MDRPLTAPISLRPISDPRPLTTLETHQLLTTFLSARSSSTMPSTSFAQLERLSDHLGVMSGAIPKSQAEAKDRERLEGERRVREERKRVREEELERRRLEAEEISAKEAEAWQVQLEGLGENEDQIGGVDGVQDMLDLGDKSGAGGYSEAEGGSDDDELEGAGLRDTARDDSEEGEDVTMV